MDDRDRGAGEAIDGECSAFISLMHAVSMDALHCGLDYDPDIFPSEDGTLVPAARDGILGAIRRVGGDGSPAGALKSCFLFGLLAFRNFAKIRRAAPDGDPADQAMEALPPDAGERMQTEAGRKAGAFAESRSRQIADAVSGKPDFVLAAAMAAMIVGGAMSALPEPHGAPEEEAPRVPER